MLEKHNLLCSMTLLCEGDLWSRSAYENFTNKLWFVKLLWDPKFFIPSPYTLSGTNVIFADFPTVLKSRSGSLTSHSIEPILLERGCLVAAFDWSLSVDKTRGCSGLRDLSKNVKSEKKNFGHEFLTYMVICFQENVFLSVQRNVAMLGLSIFL